MITEGAKWRIMMGWFKGSSSERQEAVLKLLAAMISNIEGIRQDIRQLQLQLQHYMSTGPEQRSGPVDLDPVPGPSFFVDLSAGHIEGYAAEELEIKQ